MSGAPTSEPPTLAEALAALERAALLAGIEASQARREGEVLSAAIAESATGAWRDWGTATGARDADSFFQAASKGRRWRGAPTALLSQLVLDGSRNAPAYASALADVSRAACRLGEPTTRVVGNAALAAAIQLSAAGASPAAPVEALDLSSAPGRGSVSGVDGSVLETGGISPQPPDQLDQQGSPEEKPKTLDELLAELDALTGLASVKAEIHRQVAVLRVESLRTEAGLKSPTITRHLVFVGNPGTGKTTVARLVGGIYRALGLLDKGQLVEVDRSELVAGYLGQTAMKTAEVVASAEGGVLFIDEAYSLAGDQYGTEAVDTLVKEMEDKRDRLVVIVAGYPDPMAIFVAQNPGLASRFRTTIEFTDYTDDELTEIFVGLAGNADYDVTDDCRRRFRAVLATTPRGPTFGNGRFARNMLEAAIGRHAWRLRDVEKPTVEQLRALVAGDLDAEPTEPYSGGSNDDAPGAFDHVPDSRESIAEVSEREAPA